MVRVGVRHETTTEQVGRRGRDWPPPLWRRPVVWVGAILTLVLLAIAGTWWWQREEPRRVADDFLQAVADGDLQRAAEIGPQPLSDPADVDVLTVTIPPAEGPDITGWSIDEVERTDSRALVRATVEAAGEEHPAEFTVRDGALSSVDYPSVRFQIPNAAGGIAVNDEVVGLSNLYGMTLGGIGIGTIYLNPGTHTLALPERGEFVSTEPHTVELPPDFSTRSATERLELTYDLTAAGEDEIDRLFRELVEGCLRGEQPSGGDCPVSDDDLHLGPGPAPEGTWEVREWPTLEIEPVANDDGWRASATDFGEAVFTITDPARDDQGQEQVVAFNFTSRVDLQPDGSLAFT